MAKKSENPSMNEAELAELDELYVEVVEELNADETNDETSS